MNNNMLFEKAVIFAAKAHDGQSRKGDGAPYIIHPFMVATILREQQCSEQTIIAGLLHDTVEDSDITIEDIKQTFGSEIASIVAACTEADKSMPWEERKQRALDSIRHASTETKYVVCADKLHNLRAMSAAYEAMGDTLWSRFNRGYEQQKWYTREMLTSLFFGLDQDAIKPMFLEYEKLAKEFYSL